jgi:hypothetical protein
VRPRPSHHSIWLTLTGLALTVLVVVDTVDDMKWYDQITQPQGFEVWEERAWLGWLVIACTALSILLLGAIELRAERWLGYALVGITGTMLAGCFHGYAEPPDGQTASGLIVVVPLVGMVFAGSLWHLGRAPRAKNPDGRWEYTSWPRQHRADGARFAITVASAFLFISVALPFYDQVAQAEGAIRYDNTFTIWSTSPAAGAALIGLALVVLVLARRTRTDANPVLPGCVSLAGLLAIVVLFATPTGDYYSVTIGGLLAFVAAAVMLFAGIYHLTQERDHDRGRNWIYYKRPQPLDHPG